ncbi:MAG: hypothetical protein R3C53_06750 [Pirellulaceae bacterium]
MLSRFNIYVAAGLLFAVSTLPSWAMDEQDDRPNREFKVPEMSPPTIDEAQFKFTDVALRFPTIHLELNGEPKTRH